MPRAPYPKSRRIWMQVALCTIFAASIAAAELVTHHRRSSDPTVQVASRDYGQVDIRIPENWIAKSISAKDRKRIMFVAQEPEDAQEHQGRTLTGSKVQLPERMRPMDYLQSSDLLDESTRPIKTGTDPRGFEDITMAGQPGVLLAIRRVSEEAENIQWIACSVRRTGMVLLLQMDCPPGDSQEVDRDLLREIATSIQVKD